MKKPKSVKSIVGTVLKRNKTAKNNNDLLYEKVSAECKKSGLPEPNRSTVIRSKHKVLNGE